MRAIYEFERCHNIAQYHFEWNDDQFSRNRIEAMIGHSRIGFGGITRDIFATVEIHLKVDGEGESGNRQTSRLRKDEERVFSYESYTGSKCSQFHPSAAAVVVVNGSSLGMNGVV